MSGKFTILRALRYSRNFTIADENSCKRDADSPAVAAPTPLEDIEKKRSVTRRLRLGSRSNLPDCSPSGRVRKRESVEYKT